MKFTRREFIRDGVAAFTLSFAAPAFLVDIARAQGAVSRNLVVIYLAGGNDALSTVIPYNDPFYYSRRPSIAVPAGQVLQIGSDSSGKALGLHPRLTGLQTIFNEGRLAVIQRTGYRNSSRSHFEGTDIWGTADPNNPTGLGWLGRYLDALPGPGDPLAGWNTSGATYRALTGVNVSVPSITDPRSYSFASPNSGTEAITERNSAIRLAASVNADRPQLGFVNASAMEAFATLDRVASVVNYTSSVTYPNNGFAQALRTVAGSMSKGIGTRVYWVQTGGFDTHSNARNTQTALLRQVSTAISNFMRQINATSRANDVTVFVYSEFGRRVAANP